MIKPPHWARDAHPTRAGWVRKRELLVARKFTQAEIDEWYANKNPEETPKEVVEEKPAEVTKQMLEDMSKEEIDTFALEKGIELDRRYKKPTMIRRFLGKLNAEE